MDKDFLKKFLRYNDAIIRDKVFNANIKMKEPKLAHPKREEVGVGEDIHPQFKPSWEEVKKEVREPEQETLKGKDLLKRVYQGGKKVSYSQILDKLETHLEGHLNRGDDVKDELQDLKKGGAKPKETEYIVALQAPKNNPIYKFSNPIKAQKNATKYYKTTLYLSNRQNKKYMVKDPDGKWVSFGELDYEDFTKHGDQSRRENYLKRASNIKGNWKSNPYSANALAMRILW